MIILVVGYNRPHYYEQCINAIAKASPKHQVIISVDGGDAAAQKRYRELTPRSYAFIAHEKNLGIAHHLYEMRDLCFAQDQRVCVVEDDVVVSSNHFNIVESLFDWSDQFSDVGAVTGWASCHLSYEEKLFYKDFVSMRNTNWIAYGMKRACWMGIRDDIKEYLDKFIEKGNYRGRPHEAIRSWAREKFDVPFKESADMMPRPNNAFYGGGLFRAPRFPSSQDGMLVGAFHRNGFIKINTIVNHAFYIGVTGEHGNRGGYDAGRYGEMTLDNIVPTGEWKVWRGEKCSQ